MLISTLKVQMTTIFTKGTEIATEMERDELKNGLINPVTLYIFTKIFHITLLILFYEREKKSQLKIQI